jgi:hypothetical protein
MRKTTRLGAPKEPHIQTGRAAAHHGDIYSQRTQRQKAGHRIDASRADGVFSIQRNTCGEPAALTVIN